MFEDFLGGCSDMLGEVLVVLERFRVILVIFDDICLNFPPAFGFV